MFPLYDDNPTELFPFFTLGIMAACIAVWIWVQGAGFSGPALTDSVCAFGAIPAEITGLEPSVGGRGRSAAPCAIGGLSWTALFTSMFLHGSWFHLLANLWFLWIFGNNVEDSMGHFRFLAFYLLTGLAAALAHVASEPSSALPMVGASGAISAIMGAYVLLYPRTRIRTLLVIVVFITLVDLPAWFFLGYWFLIQLFSSFLQGALAGGGVAFWAHIGGFVAGLILVRFFVIPELVEAKRSHVRIHPSRIRHRGWW